MQKVIRAAFLALQVIIGNGAAAFLVIDLDGRGHQLLFRDHFGIVRTNRSLAPPAPTWTTNSMGLSGNFGGAYQPSTARTRVPTSNAVYPNHVLFMITLLFLIVYLIILINQKVLWLIESSKTVSHDNID